MFMSYTICIQSCACISAMLVRKVTIILSQKQHIRNIKLTAVVDPV